MRSTRSVIGSRFAGLIALGAAFLATADPAGAQTLAQAVSKAVTTNPAVAAADARSRASGHDLREARGGYFPSLDAFASYGREHADIQQFTDSTSLNQRQFNVTARQLVWDGWSTRSEVERREALLDASRSRGTDTRESIAFQTVQAFVDVLRSEALVDLARDNVQAHLRVLEKVELRLKSGVSRRADLDQARARVALARSVLAAREGRLRESLESYRRVVGEYPGDLVTPVAEGRSLLRDGVVGADLVEGAVQTETANAMQSNPAVAAAQAEVDAGDAAIRAARSGYYPRLDVEASFARDDNISGVEGLRNTESVALVARWNLFRGGSDKAREQAAVERRFAALDVLADVRRSVEENVAVAVKAKATSEERLVYLGQHVEASGATLESYQAQHDLGRRSLLDLLDAENELFTARSNHVAGQHDDLLNRYLIEAAKGTLLGALGIEAAGVASE